MKRRTILTTGVAAGLTAAAAEIVPAVVVTDRSQPGYAPTLLGAMRMLLDNGTGLWLETREVSADEPYVVRLTFDDDLREAARRIRLLAMLENGCLWPTIGIDNMLLGSVGSLRDDGGRLRSSSLTFHGHGPSVDPIPLFSIECVSPGHHPPSEGRLARFILKGSYDVRRIQGLMDWGSFSA